MRCRFSDFVFDSDTRELRRGGVAVPLQPKALRLLEVLLDRRPKALSKTELMELVWPDTFVNESSLARLATEVRAAVGDDARAPRFLRTVYGYGYAWSGEANDDGDESAKPRPARGIRLVVGPREISLVEGENILGRGEDAIARVDSAKASRHHARIVVRGGRATLEDMGSKNGTFLRGKRVDGATALRDGDEILIGPVVLVFRDAPSSATETDTSTRRSG
jgi:DNA-binding winged helix-turn-helix (wHTH) protein